MQNHRTARWATPFGAAALVVCGAWAAGCSSSSSSRGGSSTAAAVTSQSTSTTTTTTTPTPPPPPQPKVGQWYKGDLHSHSSPYSPDADRQLGDSPGVCFMLAEHVGLDFLALTDHRTLDQVNDPTYSANTLTILNGTEWGGTIHIGMVGLTQPLSQWTVDRSQPPSTYNGQIQAIYNEVHAQGGIVIANHPCQDSKVHVWLSHQFDAVEVWNAYWNFPKGYKDATEQDVDDKVQSLGLAQAGEDANDEIREAVRHRGGGANHQALKFYEANLMRGRHMAAVGGGDRHSLTFPGLPTTYVYAEDQSREKILQGIREGRTWVGAYEGPNVEFSADADGDGIFEALIGDSVPLNQTVTYKVRVQNAQDGLLEVIKDGQVLHSVPLPTNDETFTFTDSASQRAWYRLDVFEDVDFSVPQSSGLQVLALAGAIGGQAGAAALTTLGLPQGFQVSFNGQTRIPQLRLPHAYDKILNFDRLHWGYSRGAITSPIWAE